MTRNNEVVDYDYSLKTVLLGNTGVGKTQILRRLVDKEFLSDTKPTIGVEFETKLMEVQGKRVKIQVWDTAGQERYRAITSSYYRGVAGVLLVYDIADAQSFFDLPKWVEEIKANNKEWEKCSIMLIGNKIDQNHLRAIPSEEAAEYAKENGFLFVETSCLTDTNVFLGFNLLVDHVYTNMDKNKRLDDDKVAIGSGTYTHIIIPQTTPPSAKSTKKSSGQCGCST